MGQELEEQPPLVRNGVEEGAKLLLGQRLRLLVLFGLDRLADANPGGGVGSDQPVLEGCCEERMHRGQAFRTLPGRDLGRRGGRRTA